MIARLRWAVPSVDTLASRLRSEFGPMRESTQLAIRAATRALGIPTREGGPVCWGPRLPNWLDIKSAWQRRCRCTHPPADVTAWVCLRCGASRTPQADSDRRSICRWCSLECGRRCIACSGGLHYIGECQRWLHGADRRYAPTANERWFLCPDCWWCFAQAWASAPRKVQLIDLPAPVAEYMDTLAIHRRPVAGSQVLRQVTVRLARARLSVILAGRAWFLRRRLIEIATADLLQRSNGQASQACGRVSRTALKCIIWEGRVFVRGEGHAEAVCTRHQRAAAPPHVRHMRRRRNRRRRAEDEAEAPAPLRRRY